MSWRSAFAQDETTGTIRGSVEDNSTKQNRIDDVRVVIVDLNGNQYETVTNDYGDYVITGVSPGRYLMSLYKDGYETLKINRLRLLLVATPMCL